MESAESAQHSTAPLKPTNDANDLVTEGNGNVRKRTNPRVRTQDSSMRRTVSGASQRPKFTLKRAATTLFKPERKVKKGPGVVRSLVAIIRASWLNVLLIFIPISWVLNFALPKSFENKDTLVFVFTFLAIIPLAKLLAFATDDLSLRVGQTLAGLMNATLGNAVELIVSIIALVKCELQIVQSSLIGSVLSNLLLVLGMCFFAGGIKFSEQGFGVSATQLNSSLLVIAVIAVLLPGAFHMSVNGNPQNENEGDDILKMSHGVALIMLFIYGSYLFFQLYSHATLYQDDAADIVKSTRYKPREKHEKPGAEVTETPTEPTRSNTLTSQTQVLRDPENQEKEEEEEEEEPQMTVLTGAILLVLVTVLVAVTAEFLVDSINGLVDTGGISKEFVGIILLPIVGNAAEHVTAVAVSVKDKLTLSIGVAVGSSIQISLFVIPLIVTLGWILGKPLTMLFDPYESITLFLAVITVNYVVQDGKSNWLEGGILMCLYLILAVTFWFYPGSNPSEALNSCH